MRIINLPIRKMLKITYLPQDLILALLVLALREYRQFQIFVWCEVVVIIRIIRLIIELLISHSLITRCAFKFLRRWQCRRHLLVVSEILQIQFQLARLATKLRGGDGTLRWLSIPTIIFRRSLNFSVLFHHRILVKLHSIDVAVNDRNTLLLRPATKFGRVASHSIIYFNESAANATAILRLRRHNFDCIHVKAENIRHGCAGIFLLKHGRILPLRRALVRPWK